MKLRVTICTLLLAFLALGPPAWAGNNKVQVCHIPPGNPSNFHTITISENALQAHMAHGDLPGSCNSHCDQLCDDGNACTIDACDGTDRCALTHPPVNCDDSNLCTIDSCNPATGCSSTPKTCLDSNLCTVDACDPLSGQCVFPPVSCPAGQTCNPANGSCASPTVTCPCNDVPGQFHDIVAGLIPITSCANSNLGGYQIVEGTVLNDVLTGPRATLEGAMNNCSPVNQAPGTLFISLEQRQLCAGLLEQAAASQGVTCGPFNYCSPNPCVHGTCQSGNGAPICTCEPGWAGFDCSAPSYYY